MTAERIGQQLHGQQILREVSLTISPGELVAIVGASGAGKTMLLETLAGWRKPAQGTVRYDGADARTRLAGARSLLGYVPQDDIIHGELTLRRTLWHAARLRLPSGTRRGELEARVRKVLDLLGLADRAEVRVSSLSGGERKRASIGVELLTEPTLFFLDEPTSGLDPATSAAFMALLAGLAAGGATVILTTHSVTDLEQCDRVIFLTDTGEVAFAGSAGQAREHFGVTRLDEVYQLLSSASPKPSTPPAPTASPAPPAPVPGRLAPVPGPGALSQWAALTRRAAELQLRSRLTLAILLGSPVLIVAMFLVLFRPFAFASAHLSPGATQMTAFWIAFAGFFFGLSYGLPQICSEFAIVRREHHVGIGTGPYLLSKLAVLAPLLAVVDLVTIGVLRLLGRLPETGLAQTTGLLTSLLLASLAALAIGLLTSAAVAGPAQAIVAMPMLCFPQVLFSGGFVPVPAMPAAGRVISAAMSNRWAFEALGHGLGLRRLWAEGGSPLGPPLLASYAGTFSHRALTDWLVLGGFAAVLLTAAHLVLAARCRRYR